MSGELKTLLVIEWLQECYLLMESGEEERIPRYLDFHSRAGVLTDDYVDRVVEAIEAEFVHELTQYPEYHFRNADGATTPPEFTRLSKEARRAMVEGLHKILYS